jgi:hypothetical protein
MFCAYSAEFIEAKATVTQFSKLIVALIEIHKILLTSGMVYRIYTRCVGKVISFSFFLNPFATRADT